METTRLASKASTSSVRSRRQPQARANPRSGGAAAGSGGGGGEADVTMLATMIPARLRKPPAAGRAMPSLVHASPPPVARPLPCASAPAEPRPEPTVHRPEIPMEASVLVVHILAGLSALAAGFLALYSQKGRAVHRRSGRFFAIAMMAMTTTGALMALSFRPNRGNVIAATITFYLVATGLLTVIRKVQDAPRLYDALFGLGFFGSVAAWGFGLYALGLPGRTLDHIPAFAIFMFAIVGTLGVIGDGRLLRAGGIEGVARLRRHLWRMNYALWVATTSFFFGQARHLPQWMRDSNLNDYLVLLVTLTLVYWLVKLRAKKAGSGSLFRLAQAEPD